MAWGAVMNAAALVILARLEARQVEHAEDIAALRAALAGDVAADDFISLRDVARRRGTDTEAARKWLKRNGLAAEAYGRVGTTEKALTAFARKKAARRKCPPT
jgi:hypothetical protein